MLTFKGICQNDQNSIALLKIVNTLLGTVGQSVQYSSQAEREIFTLRIMDSLSSL